jgi:hypothetical protein
LWLRCNQLQGMCNWFSWLITHAGNFEIESTSLQNLRCVFFLFKQIFIFEPVGLLVCLRITALDWKRSHFWSSVGKFVQRLARYRNTRTASQNDRRSALVKSRLLNGIIMRYNVRYFVDWVRRTVAPSVTRLHISRRVSYWLCGTANGHDPAGYYARLDRYYRPLIPKRG